jgi:phospholipid/cholesterol/gamma-HCH transport system substrate-binding protein
MTRLSREARQRLVGAATIVVLATLFVAGYRDNPEKHDSDGYRLYAIYDTAIGLTPGSDVLMAGIPVGTVRSLQLKKDTNEALVELIVEDGVEIPADSEASIISEGLSGGKYIRIIPGGEFEMLQPDETFFYTRSSVDFLELFERIVQMAESRAEQNGADQDGVETDTNN